MASDHHIARFADQLRFNEPKPKRPRTVLMCVPCRDSKRKVGCQHLRLHLDHADTMKVYVAQ
jgi:hypothetical protein